jgi:hypothetical protein
LKNRSEKRFSIAVDWPHRVTSFSRIFLIHKNLLLYHSNENKICVVDLVKGFNILTCPTTDISHFTIKNNILFILDNQKYISKLTISEAGISEPFKKSDNLGCPLYVLHTICRCQ